MEPALNEGLTPPKKAKEGLAAALQTLRARLPLQGHQAAVLAAVFSDATHVRAAGADLTELNWDCANPRKVSPAFPIGGVNRLFIPLTGFHIFDLVQLVAALKDDNNKPAVWMRQHSPDLQNCWRRQPTPALLLPALLLPNPAIPGLPLPARSIPLGREQRGFCATGHAFAGNTGRDAPRFSYGGSPQTASIACCCRTLSANYQTAASDAENTVAYSPDGTLRATADTSVSPSAVFCSGVDQVAIPSDACEIRAGVAAIALSSNASGRLLAVGDTDRNVFIFDVGTHKIIRKLPRMNKPIRALTFSPDLAQLLMCGCRMAR